MMDSRNTGAAAGSGAADSENGSPSGNGTAPKGTTARLLVTCSDRPGIVAAVSGFLLAYGANIIHSDQHSSDPKGGRFFLRQEFYLDRLEYLLDDIRRNFAETVAERFGMDWQINPGWVHKRTAILVSKFDHALMEVLWRWKQGELPMEITRVISNHEDLRAEVETFGVPFVHIPVAPEGKAEAEARLLAELEGGTDLILLARYMQILSGEVVDRYPGRIINIHHSFLPAFVGADPYRRAAQRGVKLIGATAHYVTETLDEGPIIEQDVIRVSHRNRLGDLKVLGRDIERQVFARAVKWHLEDRVIVDGNKTIVFV